MDESASTRHEATVAPEQAGQRLDKWLATLLPALSRTRIQALIDGGQVRCAGATITEAARRVKFGEAFAVTVPPAVEAAPLAQAMALPIVYEDEHLIVVDKPAGLVVHPAPGSPDMTLVNALLAHCGDSLSGIGGVKRPGIVHRLDKDTSGLLVAAKTDAAHRGLATQFAAHSIERAYYALVWGVPQPAQGTITGNIGRSPANRKKMAVVRGGGKEAVTHYKVLRRFGDVASLVECRLETGRTHQIRVHMTALGHPLIGDQTYGRSRTAKLPAVLRPTIQAFPRQALHAFLLGFDHPVTKARLSYLSDIPPDISRLVQSLETV